MSGPEAGSMWRVYVQALNLAVHSRVAWASVRSVDGWTPREGNGRGKCSDGQSPDGTGEEILSLRRRIRNDGTQEDSDVAEEIERELKVPRTWRGSASS
jgi:hypothetical protein